MPPRSGPQIGLQIVRELSKRSPLSFVQLTERLFDRGLFIILVYIKGCQMFGSHLLGGPPLRSSIGLESGQRPFGQFNCECHGNNLCGRILYCINTSRPVSADLYKASKRRVTTRPCAPETGTGVPSASA